MKGRLEVYWIPSLIFVLALFLSPAARAQDDAQQSPGMNSGDYNIHQTIEFGYRSSNINGNMNTYDTFENLGSGLRLFDFNLSMRSIDHQAPLFDTLTFSNFGYGGDPNDVSRMRVEKNKWYDFRLLFRRDKNFWDYNLFVNPLNPAALNPAGSLSTGCYVGPPTAAFPEGAPAYCSNPAVAQGNSLHALDLTRRMQDYDLTLLPTSKVRFRLGYSRNRDQGPSGFTTDSGTISDFEQINSYTTNAFRAGIDVRLWPRTTISFDEFLSYFKQDNVVLDNPAATPGNFGFILANPTGLGTPAGTPVDLGNIWSTQTAAETLPCAVPVVAGTTNTATPTCNGFLSYSQVGNPRNFMPTERLRFESSYFQNFEMSGSLGYSTSNNVIPDFLETVDGYTARTGERGSTTGGPADAKRVSVNADWSGVYAITDKLRILDSFRYDNWRIPGMWALDETNIFGTGYPGLAGLQQSEAFFNAANCPVASNAVTCPYHTATSAADAITGLATSFLGQDLKSNTLQLQYDFNRRWRADIGYLHTSRTIAQYSDTNDTESIYFPGGATAAAGNDYLAARGSCALVAGALPAGCTLNADGSVTYVPPGAASPVRSLTSIDQDSLLLGFVGRPLDTLRITGDFEFGYNNAAYTRIDARQVQSYKIHANYKPRPWATLDGAVDIHENRDNVATVNNLEHDRSYSFSTILTASARLSVDFGYNYWDVYTQSLICFAFSETSANPAPPPATVTAAAFPPGVPMLPGGPACPISGATSPLGALATYSSTDHFAHAAAVWKPWRRVTTIVGYGGSFVRGNTIFLNPLTPSGALDYNYQRPYASIAIDVARGFTYKMSWNYYGFNETGNSNPFGLAAIPLQDFNGSNATFSFRYSF
ncbi:MAG: hypothetical protein ABSG16_17180 [Candidatus Acidiferrum sp.]|jgi:hypothetical protein